MKIETLEKIAVCLSSALGALLLMLAGYSLGQSGERSKHPIVYEVRLTAGCLDAGLEPQKGK